MLQCMTLHIQHQRANCCGAKRTEAFAHYLISSSSTSNTSVAPAGESRQPGTPHGGCQRMCQRTAGDLWPSTSATIAQVGGDGELALLAHAHVDQPLVPALRLRMGEVSITGNGATGVIPGPLTLITCPVPSVNVKGWLRSRLESNLDPSLYSMPV